MCLAVAANLLSSPALSFAQAEKPLGLAVMHLKGMGISEVEAETLTETLHSSVSQILLNPAIQLKEKYSLLERSQMDKILDQFNVQNFACADDSCAVEFGKMLAVQRIIVGSIGVVGETFMISGRMVDVESSRVIRAVSRKYQGKIDGVLDILPLVGHELLTGVRLPDPPKTLPRTLPNASRTIAQPEISYLTIKGTPASAEALINGQGVGQTPVQQYALPPGKYTVAVRNAGFTDFKDEIDLAPGKRHTLKYTLSSIAKVTIESMPNGAEVSINGKRAGETPLRDFTVIAGANEISIKRMGYETHHARVTVSQKNPLNLNPVLIPKTRNKALLKSLLLPGFGQRYSEHKSKGAFISVLQAAAIAGVVVATIRNNNTQNEYDDAYTAYKRAATPDDIKATRKLMKAKHDTVTTARNTQNVVIGATAIIYLYNVIDAALTTPKIEVKMPVSSLSLEPYIAERYTSFGICMRF